MSEAGVCWEPHQCPPCFCDIHGNKAINSPSALSLDVGANTLLYRECRDDCAHTFMADTIPRVKYYRLTQTSLKAIVSSQTRNSTSRILSLLMSEFASQCLGSYVAVIHFQK